VGRDSVNVKDSVILTDALGQGPENVLIGLLSGETNGLNRSVAVCEDVHHCARRVEVHYVCG
jgi:hypothetical protein